MKWKLWVLAGSVIAALVVVTALLSYRWGYSEAESEMAQAREEAVREAVALDRRERARDDLAARQRERERLRKLREELAELREKDLRLREFQSSDEADRQALTPEALEIYRSY